jgi:membrane-bound metal-dependent hydrolase YbcI (DUF457 family)
MANFAVHVGGGIAAGLGCTAMSLLVFDFKNPWFAATAGVTAIVGSMLPDIDHDEAIPIREVFGVLAAAIPAMAMPYLMRVYGLSTEQGICFFSATYLAIRFVVAPIFKAFTVHRGIFHSLPFIVAAGQALALGLVGLNPMERLLIGISLMFGALVHLILDEIYAVDFTGRRLKKSFGTAIKLWSPDLIPTMLCYGALLGLTAASVLRLGPLLQRLFFK